MDLFLTVKWIGQLTVQFVVHVLAGQWPYAIYPDGFDVIAIVIF